jgi:hypothetical protein
MIIYNFLKHLIIHIKYLNILKKVYKEEDLVVKLSQLFSTPFKIDWIGRVYAVFNPYVMEEKFNYNTQIYEYNENGLDDTVYVEKWIMEKLNIASQFIKNNDLFDILTYEIKKIDEYGNYLFVMKPITSEDCWTWVKRFMMLMGGLVIVGVTLLIIF